MKVPKQVSLRHLAIIVISTILLTSFVFYVLAATPTSTFWISSGVYPGAPSYTIWREGSNYFAKDANGQIEFSGTDADAVIEASLDTGDSPILLAEGIFVTNAPLNLSTNYQKLMGVGRWATEIRYSGSGAAIIMGSNSSGAVRYHLAIDSLAVNLTSSAAYGIYAVNIRESKIADVEVFGGINAEGIRVDGVGTWSATSEISDIRMNNMHKGIIIDGTGINQVNGIIIRNGYIIRQSGTESGSIGIYLGVYGASHTIESVWINGFAEGLKVEADHCSVYRLETEVNTLGINITSNSWGTSIFGAIPYEALYETQLENNGAQTSFLMLWGNRYLFQLPAFAYNPNVTTWGDAQKGIMWFETTSNVTRYWNGTDIISFP